NRGNGFLLVLAFRMMFQSSRCCSSACGIAILEKSIQSGCTSPVFAPKYRSSLRMGACASRSWPDHAGLPSLICTMDRARSNVNATAVPLPTVRIVTAGDRKSTRLNSSHVEISYAVFCLKKKKHKEALNKQKGTTNDKT